MPVIDEYGTMGFTQEEIIDQLKVNPKFDITGLMIVDGEQYINARAETNMDIIDDATYLPEISIWKNRSYEFSPSEYHRELQKHWLMPDEYKTMDIKKYLLSMCKNQIEIDRVNQELYLYEKYEIIDLLRYLKYLKDTADKNNIVWGVGRGSSCCSYCLFLLKIHRVDSIKYNLEIAEFLRN